MRSLRCAEPVSCDMPIFKEGQIVRFGNMLFRVVGPEWKSRMDGRWGVILTDEHRSFRAPVAKVSAVQN